MDNKFSVIMNAKEAKRNVEDFQETEYQQSESFLISYIARAISTASREGKDWVRIHTTQPCFPLSLTSYKVMEHLASPLYQLGYKCRICSDSGIEISWSKRKNNDVFGEEWEDGSF